MVTAAAAYTDVSSVTIGAQKELDLWQANNVHVYNLTTVNSLLETQVK